MKDLVSTKIPSKRTLKKQLVNIFIYLDISNVTYKLCPLKKLEAKIPLSDYPEKNITFTNLTQK